MADIARLLFTPPSLVAHLGLGPWWELDSGNCLKKEPFGSLDIVVYPCLSMFIHVYPCLSSRGVEVFQPKTIVCFAADNLISDSVIFFPGFSGVKFS